MKKILITTVAVFMTAGVFAQALKHQTINDDMRIFSKEREEILTNFNAPSLGSDIRVSVVLPMGYDKDLKSYPVVYIFTERNLSKEQTDKAFYDGKSGLRPAVFITLQTVSEIPSDKMSDFLGRDILPYFETNYRLLVNPSDRVIIAEGQNAVKVLDALADLSGYSNKIALILPDTTPMAGIKAGLPQNINIWAAGNASNMARLQALLEQEGLKAFRNFAYRIVNIKDDEPYYAYADLNYLMEKQDYKITKVKAELSKKSLSALTENDNLSMWFKVNTKTFASDYIPQIVKISPPFFAWDNKTAKLSVIYGATAQKVKVWADIPDYKTVSESIKVTK